MCVYGYLKQRKLAISKMVVANYPRSNASPYSESRDNFVLLFMLKETNVEEIWNIVNVRNFNDD